MTIKISLAATVAIALHLSQVSAVPNVTVVPLGPGTCVYWPNWIGFGSLDHLDFSPGLGIAIDQSDNDALNGLPLNSRTWNFGDTPIPGYVADLRKSREFARAQFFCRDGKLTQGQSGPTIMIEKDVRNGYLSERAGGYMPEVYAHEINGVRQPGVFLGVKNQTTWGFDYVAPQACGELDYYQVRLMGLPVDPTVIPRATNDPRVFGFLKVSA